MATSSPCAACKFLRRKCQAECVFAPYFPPDQPQKFSNVHKVFGASNVAKLLNELHPCQREDAVNSLAYEADMRLRDPVYGCVGVISLLQHQLRQLQMDLTCAKSELSKYQTTNIAGQHLLMGTGHHPFFSKDHHHINQQQHMLIGNNNSCYDNTANLLAMNVSAIGQQISHFHHSAPIARQDDRPSIVLD